MRARENSRRNLPVCCRRSTMDPFRLGGRHRAHTRGRRGLVVAVRATPRPEQRRPSDGPPPTNRTRPACGSRLRVLWAPSVSGQDDRLFRIRYTVCFGEFLASISETRDRRAPAHEGSRRGRPGARARRRRRHRHRDQSGPGADANSFRGLRTLRTLTADRFIGGVVLTLGPHAFTAEDHIHVLPVDSLWRR